MRVLNGTDPRVLSGLNGLLGLTGYADTNSHNAQASLVSSTVKNPTARQFMKGDYPYYFTFNNDATARVARTVLDDLLEPLQTRTAMWGSCETAGIVDKYAGTTNFVFFGTNAAASPLGTRMHVDWADACNVVFALNQTDRVR